MMETINYQTNHDQEVYVHSHEKVGEENLYITGCTVSGTESKPNEDAFALTIDGPILFAAVFDGCTSLKPIPKLGEETGARYASHYLKDHFKPTSSITARSLVSLLNKELFMANSQLGGSLSDIHTLASSTGTFVKIDTENRSIEISHVGDSFCIVYYSDGHSDLITTNHNKKFDDQMFAMIADIAKDKSITPREAREDLRVKEALIKLFIRKFNAPDGSGTGYINGDPNMEQYVQSTTLSFDRVSAILLGSDGLFPQGNLTTDEADRKAVLEVIALNGIEGLIQKKKQSEDEDPEWNHIRYKHSDDATGLLIEL